MQSTQVEDEDYSTVPEDWRRPLWIRFLASLALLGFLVGLMIGRLTDSPARLLEVQPLEQGLALYFDHRPKLQEQWHEGTFSLLIDAWGVPQKGQVRVQDALVNWRLNPLVQTQLKQQLSLGFVAVRPLQARWSQQEVEQGWRLEIELNAL